MEEKEQPKFEVGDLLQDMNDNLFYIVIAVREDDDDDHAHWHAGSQYYDLYEADSYKIIHLGFAYSHKYLRLYS